MELFVYDIGYVVTPTGQCLHTLQCYSAYVYHLLQMGGSIWLTQRMPKAARVEKEVKTQGSGLDRQRSLPLLTFGSYDCTYECICIT